MRKKNPDYFCRFNKKRRGRMETRQALEKGRRRGVDVKGLYISRNKPQLRRSEPTTDMARFEEFSNLREDYAALLNVGRAVIADERHYPSGFLNLQTLLRRNNSLQTNCTKGKTQTPLQHNKQCIPYGSRASFDHNSISKYIFNTHCTSWTSFYNKKQHIFHLKL